MLRLLSLLLGCAFVPGAALEERFLCDASAGRCE